MHDAFLGLVLAAQGASSANVMMTLVSVTAHTTHCTPHDGTPF
jgi:hypothetical protein